MGTRMPGWMRRDELGGECLGTPRQNSVSSRLHARRPAADESGVGARLRGVLDCCSAWNGSEYPWNGNNRWSRTLFPLKELRFKITDPNNSVAERQSLRSLGHARPGQPPWPSARRRASWASIKGRDGPDRPDGLPQDRMLSAPLSPPDRRRIYLGRKAANTPAREPR